LRNVIRKDIDKHILIRENKDEKNWFDYYGNR
jgi:hypothetical protein